MRRITNRTLVSSLAAAVALVLGCQTGDPARSRMT
jgi:hypothetical protein